jgi:predicted unusual protein kinase regulating ubiquinone biosynthesis (AarF/ABC1/UbiB family)
MSFRWVSLRYRRYHYYVTRPLLVTTAGVSLAWAVEWYADHSEAKERNDLSVTHRKKGTPTSLSLPREYDWERIHHYWMHRPISVLSRLLTAVTELSPILYRYFREVRPLERLAKQEQQHDCLNDDQTVRHQPDSLNNTITSNNDLKLQQLHQLLAIQLRDALTNLGPAFVKAGQQLSIRPDLVPPIVLSELSQLCDAVRPIPDTLALTMLQNELQHLLCDHDAGSDKHSCRKIDSIFRTLTLVASASLGQVYKAELETFADRGSDNNKEPQVVAVKVQRQDIKRIFSLDLFLLRNVGVLIDSITSMTTQQPPFHHALYQSFAEGSYLELDYENEAQNQEYFRDELIRKRNCPILIPKVYLDLTTERVLTTEWIDGIKLADAPKEQIRQLIPIGVDLFLIQLLEIGKFHADPYVHLLIENSHRH